MSKPNIIAMHISEEYCRLITISCCRALEAFTKSQVEYARSSTSRTPLCSIPGYHLGSGTPEADLKLGATVSGLDLNNPIQEDIRVFFRILSIYQLSLHVCVLRVGGEKCGRGVIRVEKALCL